MTTKKPNIIIWGDDIGQSNISAYPPSQKSASFSVDQVLAKFSDVYSTV